MQVHGQSPRCLDILAEPQQPHGGGVQRLAVRARVLFHPWTAPAARHRPEPARNAQIAIDAERVSIRDRRFEPRRLGGSLRPRTTAP
jgi:hypothetical protein